MLKSGWFGAGFFLGIALMLGRLTGLARELIIASSLGVSTEADAAIILLTIPDMLVNLLLSGGLAVALIPLLKKSNRSNRLIILNQTGILVLCIFSTLGFILYLIPEVFFTLIAPGFDTREITNFKLIILLISISLPLTALSGVTTAGLNAENSFFVPGCGTLIFNFCVIVAIAIGMTSSIDILLYISFGIFVGVTLRLLSQISFLRIIYNCQHLFFYGQWFLNRTLLIKFLYGLTAASLLILVPVFMRSAASILGVGQLAMFNYSLKLVELPVAILITTISTIAYPKLSKAFSDNNETEFNQILNVAIYKSVVLSFSVVLCALQYTEPAIDLLFGFEKITFDQRLEISKLIQILIVGVPFIGFSAMLATAMNARHDTLAVLIISFISLSLLIPIMLPGLFLESNLLLAASQPFFYLILSLLLCVKFRSKILFNSKLQLFYCLIVMSLIFYFFVSIDYLLSHSFLPTFLLTVLRTGVGACSFGCMIVYGLSKIKINK